MSSESISATALVVSGYSDRINHALAFAAKHHDKQVRGGTRPPYLTQPANVGVILTRYGRDEETVVAGILYEVAEDYARGGFTREMFDRRIGDKFGSSIVDALLAVVPRRADDAGVELSQDQRREDQLTRLGQSTDAGRWILSATALHSAASLLADLRRTVEPDSVWGRYAGGRAGVLAWYRRLRDRLSEVAFDAPIVRELSDVVSALEDWHA